MPEQNAKPSFAVCVTNDGSDDLSVGMLYRILHNVDATAENLLRVIDDSGEDYLYPADKIALDHTTAGCVDTFLDRGSLDTWRLAVLGLCYHRLALVVPQLEGQERLYFCRLETLARLALERTRDGSQAT